MCTTDVTERAKTTRPVCDKSYARSWVVRHRRQRFDIGFTVIRGSGRRGQLDCRYCRYGGGDSTSAVDDRLGSF